MIYKINQNSHRSVWFPRMTFKNKISFTFKFLSAIPQTEYTNKVYGLIDGIFPHKNSVRVGFRKIKNKVQLSSIVYNNGKRTITPLVEIDENTISVCTIIKQKHEYVIYIDFKKFVFKRTSNFNLFSFRLFPYWGGVDKAPSDITLEIFEAET